MLSPKERVGTEGLNIFERCLGGWQAYRLNSLNILILSKICGKILSVITKKIEIEYGNSKEGERRNGVREKQTKTPERGNENESWRTLTRNKKDVIIQSKFINY